MGISERVVATLERSVVSDVLNNKLNNKAQLQLSDSLISTKRDGEVDSR